MVKKIITTNCIKSLIFGELRKSISERTPTKKIKIIEKIKKKFVSDKNKAKVINKNIPPLYVFLLFKYKNFLCELLLTFSTKILNLIKIFEIINKKKDPIIKYKIIKFIYF